MTEPVVAERPRHARDESPLSTTSDGVEEDAEGVSLRSRPGSPAGSDKSPVDHDAGLQAILDEQRQKDTRSEDSQEDETEGMEVDTDHQSQDASVGQAAENRQHTDAEKAAIKKEWKRVGRPICTATLPNGEGCGMYHPRKYHPTLPFSLKMIADLCLQTNSTTTTWLCKPRRPKGPSKCSGRCIPTPSSLRSPNKSVRLRSSSGARQTRPSERRRRRHRMDNKSPAPPTVKQHSLRNRTRSKDSRQATSARHAISVTVSRPSTPLVEGLF